MGSRGISWCYHIAYCCSPCLGGCKCFWLDDGKVCCCLQVDWGAGGSLGRKYWLSHNPSPPTRAPIHNWLRKLLLQFDPLDYSVVSHACYLNGDRLETNLNFCMVSVNVNVESARRKCQDLYVIRFSTYSGMSWHFRSVAVNGRLGKTLTLMEERSTFGNTKCPRRPRDHRVKIGR